MGFRNEGQMLTVMFLSCLSKGSCMHEESNENLYNFLSGNLV